MASIIDYRFDIGEKARTDMGVRREGVVVFPFSWKDCTDGQYRSPESKDGSVVWVQWNDGTRGWIQKQFLLPG